MQQDQPTNDQNNNPESAVTSEQSQLVDLTQNKNNDTSNKNSSFELDGSKRRKSITLAIIAFIVGCATSIFFINIIGTPSGDYDYVNLLSNAAGFIGFAMAIGIGVLFGYRTTTNQKLKKGNPIWRYTLAALSFIFGFVPGLIIMIIITWPISSRACELSGSKNC